MTKFFYTFIIVLMSASFIPTAVQAASSDDVDFAAIAVFPPIQLPLSDSNVKGVRLSLIAGRHKSLDGADISVFGGITDSDFTGLAMAGGFNYTGKKARVYVGQFAGLGNYNAGQIQIYGLQLSGFNINKGTGHTVGAQVGVSNYSPKSDVFGFQVGLYNQAKDVYGFQIGLINVAKNLHGIQLGLANINQEGSIRFLPIVNVGF